MKQRAPYLATWLAFLMISSVMLMIYSPNDDIVEMPILEDEAETQTLDTSARVSQSDSPIRTTEKNRYYDNTGYTWSSAYNRYTWTQDLDNRPIGGDESHEFWFYVSSENVGSYLYADLNTDDVNWGQDPDLDLYLYNPSGTQVDSSISTSSWTESVSGRATSSGYWRVKVKNYESFSGQYDLDRTFKENAAPKVDLTQSPSNNWPPYIHENWNINACNSYDPEGGSLSYSWRIDGATQSGYCLKSVTFHDSNTHTISVTVSDSSGKSSTETTTITPRAFPTSTRPMGDLVVSMDDDRTQTASKQSGTYKIDIPYTTNDFWTYLELEYKFKVTQSGEVTYSSEMIEMEEDDSWRLDMEIGHIDGDYKLEFKPEIVLWFYFADDGQWRDLRLPVPSLVQVDSYPNQPSFEYYYETADGDWDSYTIYYWGDYVEIPLETENGAMTYSLNERVQLSGIDLYPFVEELIDHYTGSDYATRFLDWFGDFEIPLSYNLDMEIMGHNYIDVITKIDGGHTQSGANYAEHILQNHHTDPDRLTASLEITRTDPVLEIDQMVLLYKYVSGDVTPNLDLRFKYNGVTKATIDMATWDTESFFSASRRYQSSTIHFEWELDSDNDGVADSIDAFPFDRTQQTDADGDGYGDNQNGNNPDTFWLDPTQWLDTDADGYGNNENGNNPDAFPNDRTQQTDADGDGFGDNPSGKNPDACPSEFGTSHDNPAMNGCPDSDGDGILDFNDLCENTDSTGDAVDENGCTNSQLDLFDKEYSIAGTTLQMPIIFSVGLIFIITIISILFIATRRKSKNSEIFDSDWDDNPSFSYESTPVVDQFMAPPLQGAPPTTGPPTVGPAPTTGPPTVGPVPTTGPPTMGPIPTTGPPMQYEADFGVPVEFSTILQNESDSIEVTTSIGPPPNSLGEIGDDGYEWLEFENSWYWREPNTIDWNQFE